MGGLEEFGKEKMKLLPLGETQGQILGGLRIKKIIIWVELK